MPNHPHDQFKLVPPTGADFKSNADPSDLPTLTDRINPDHEAQLNLDEVPPAPKDTLPSLTSLRLQKNQSIDSVAGALRLKPAQVTALENQQWDALPGTAYIKGFLRSYCRYLNVAPEAYLAQYDASQQAPSNQAPSLNQPPIVMQKDPTALSSFKAGANEAQSNKLMFGLLGLLLAATVAFLAFWERDAWLPSVNSLAKPSIDWVNQQIDGKPNTTPVVAAPNANLAIPAPAAAPVLAPAAAPAPTLDSTLNKSPAIAVDPATNTTATTPTGPQRILNIKIDKQVWLEIRDSGNNVVYTGMRNAGVNDTIQAAAPISVSIGAADAVALTVDGKTFDVAAQAKQNVAKFAIQ